MKRRFRREVQKKEPQKVSPVLQEANYAFTNSDYVRAAELFEKIAQTADEQGSQRAYIFHLRAGHARILARQELLGIPSLRHGLELLSKNKQFQKLHMAGMRAVSDLKACGLKDEAVEIQAWLKRTLTEVPTTRWPENLATLPKLCPSCGAPLRPDDVDWVDNNTAECGYCGNAVR